VELTPEREYLLVTEFFDGATELGEAKVEAEAEDGIIDDGLRIIRKLWDAGLAHRDIKPANLLVRNGQLLLIDVAFVEGRPTPWRQAVDLANMMLCLALRSTAEQVYQRALRQFSVEEITEGFAAARGLALPSQLRRMLRDKGRDLHGEFLQLLPKRPRPIRIQRWSARRAGLLALIVALAALLVPATVFTLANDYQHLAPLHIVSLGCGEPEPLWLLAQSVPSASLIPCVRTLPPGWRVATAKAKDGLSEFTLAHDTDSQAVIVRLTAACTTSGATQQPSNQPGARRYERTDDRTGQLTWYTVFAGGCIITPLHSAKPPPRWVSPPAAICSRHSTRAPTGDSTSTRSQHDDRPPRTHRQGQRPEAAHRAPWLQVAGGRLAARSGGCIPPQARLKNSKPTSQNRRRCVVVTDAKELDRLDGPAPIAGHPALGNLLLAT